jgi:hypothetical protein
MIQNGRMTLEVVPDWRWTPLVRFFRRVGDTYRQTLAADLLMVGLNGGRATWLGGLQAQKCPQHEVPRSRNRRQDPCLDRCHSVVLAGKLSKN